MNDYQEFHLATIEDERIKKLLEINEDMLKKIAEAFREEEEEC